MASSASSSAAASSSSSSSTGTPKEQLAAMLEDPRYKQGVALTKEGKYDEALEFLGACVALVASEDDLSLAAAPVYFAYGDALLSKAEDSVDLFGAAMTAAKEKAGDGGEEEEEEEQEEEEDMGGEGQEPGGGKMPASSSMAASSSSGGGDGGAAEEEEEEEEGGGGGETSKVGIPEEMQEDLEVAWENLEAARVIYHKHEKEGEGVVDPKRVGEVYLRLGDLQKNNGNFAQAVEDYLKSLEIYGKVCGPDSRVIAELHYQLAMTYVYASGVASTEAGAGRGGGGGGGGGEGGLKRKALDHYEKCARVFELLVAKAQAAAAAADEKGDDDKGKAPAMTTTRTSSSSNPKEDLKEFQEILDELRETIEATKQELLAEADPMGMGGKAGPVTTVGFGIPLPPSSSSSSSSSSSALAAAAGAEAGGEGGSSNGGAIGGAGSSSTANVMMAVKKKAKPAAPAAAAAAAAGGPATAVAATEKKKEEGVVVVELEVEEKQQQLKQMEEEKSSPKKRLATEQTEGPAEPPVAKEARSD